MSIDGYSIAPGKKAYAAYSVRQVKLLPDEEWGQSNCVNGIWPTHRINCTGTNSPANCTAQERADRWYLKRFEFDLCFCYRVNYLENANYTHYTTTNCIVNCFANMFQATVGCTPLRYSTPLDYNTPLDYDTLYTPLSNLSKCFSRKRFELTCFQTRLIHSTKKCAQQTN